MYIFIYLFIYIYAVFHVEFESAVKNKQFLQPGWKIEEKQIKT